MSTATQTPVTTCAVEQFAAAVREMLNRAIEQQAEALVNGLRAELQRTTDALQDLPRKPSVFVFDSGTDIPVRYASPPRTIRS